MAARLSVKLALITSYFIMMVMCIYNYPDSFKSRMQHFILSIISRCFQE